MIIPVKTQTGTYNIYLERGALKNAGEYLDLKRKVLIVTDTGVPKEYAKTVADACSDAVIVTINEGEKSKNIDTVKSRLFLARQYLKKHLNRDGKRIFGETNDEDIYRDCE